MIAFISSHLQDILGLVILVVFLAGVFCTEKLSRKEVEKIKAIQEHIKEVEKDV